jgi:TonB family protein
LLNIARILSSSQHENMQLRQTTIAFLLSIIVHAAALLYFTVKLPSAYKQQRPIDVIFETSKSPPPKKSENRPNTRRVLAMPSERKPEIPIQPDLIPTEKVPVIEDLPVNSEVPVKTEVPATSNIAVISPKNNFPQTEKIETVSNLTRIPSPLKKIDVTYPASERRAGIQSYVLAEVIINTQGIVQDVHILKSGGSAFDTSVRDTLRKTVFTPGYIGEKAVPVRISIPFRFNLS